MRMTRDKNIFAEKKGLPHRDIEKEARTWEKSSSSELVIATASFIPIDNTTPCQRALPKASAKEILVLSFSQVTWSKNISQAKVSQVQQLQFVLFC